MSESKSAIVTGSSRGIGAAIAKRLAADGFNVVVNYAGRADAAAAIVAEITATGGKAIAVQADVSNPTDVKNLFDKTIEAFGEVNILINSAGKAATVNVADTTDEQFDAIANTNFKGTFNTLREAGQRMPNGGRIINISTTVVASKVPGHAVYTASKAAVESLTAIMAKELQGRNITINAVAPGPVATEMLLEGKTEEELDQRRRANPLGRLGEPEDIAAAVSFLAGPDGGWINGQTIRANGGIA